MTFNESLRLVQQAGERRRAVYKKIKGSGWQDKVAIWLSHGVSSEMKFKVMKRKRRRKRKRKRRDSEKS